MQHRQPIDTIVAAVFKPFLIGRSNTKAAVAGLVVGWVGTALLVSPLARDLDDPSRLPYALVGQARFWALAASVVASVLFWEKQPLRSLWLQQFRWQSIAWGLLLVAAYYTMLFPLGRVGAAGSRPLGVRGRNGPGD